MTGFFPVNESQVCELRQELARRRTILSDSDLRTLHVAEAHEVVRLERNALRLKNEKLTLTLQARVADRQAGECEKAANALAPEISRAQSELESVERERASRAAARARVDEYAEVR